MKQKLIFPAILLCLLMFPNRVNSQVGQTDFLRGSFDDAGLLFKEYLTPYANIFGANLNSGWYNTAKVHKPLGFDLTISASAAWAPAADKTFDLGELTALKGTVIGPSGTPTIAGKADTRPDIAYYAINPVDNSNVEVARFTMPNGTGLSVLPLPMGQLGIGLPFGTEITGRLLPNINIGDYGNIGMWGVGIKHSIMQWIPGLKMLPILDITAQGGFTNLLTYANLSVEPSDLGATDQTAIPDPLRFKNQKVELGIKALTVNLLISQTLPVITFYQGIGLSSSNSNVALLGNFPLASIDNSGNLVVTDNDVKKDPFSESIESNKNLRLNAGFRIKLGVITIHGDYTKANYSVFTTGLGISFR